MIRLSVVKLSIDDDNIKKAASEALRIDEDDVLNISVVKKSVDARFGKINFVYTIDVLVNFDENAIIKKVKNASLSPEQKTWSLKQGTETLHNNPIIIGAGPAGLFSALVLCRYGFKPTIIERGKKVEDRDKDVGIFFNNGNLSENSNICFGEGGAGTYSDGKLKTRISDPRCFYVLDELKKAGAPEEIMYDANPHIGTDVLKKVIVNIRKEIEKNGGTFLFESKVDKIEISNDRVKSVVIGDRKIDTDVIIIATGHSARDTYEMLNDIGVQMEQKTFAMGVRIEHPREVIDKALYHDYAGNEKLGAASYYLSVDTDVGKVYTFCMCPGGVVVNSASESDGLCVNGMSTYKRNNRNSNSAIVSQVTPDMLRSNDVLAGIEFQRKYERLAFKYGGFSYAVPAMRVCDFISDNKPKDFEIMPTVLPKAVVSDIKYTLPENIYKAIKQAIPKMGQKLKGFDMGGAVLSSVESRTSSPVRITRGSDFMSVNTKGLYPAGEGAGYAGGIVSSAVDGLRVAGAIIEQYSSRKGNN